MTIAGIIISVLAAVLLAAGTAVLFIRKRPRLILRVLTVTAAVFAELVVVFFLYVENYCKADETALSYVSGREGTVTVTETDGGRLFDGSGTSEALIFYPGGKVEAEAYAPLLYRIAESGTDCFLAEMPLRLAIFDIYAADRIISRYDYENWYIAGHSLGGVAAAAYASDNSAKLKGLILLAAYPTAKLDDSLLCLTVTGSKDGVLDREKYEQNADKLPSGTRTLVIEGGNHCGFGSYGFQSGDNEADITPAEQWDITARAVSELIAEGAKK